jgi:hypothetical protein
MNCESCGAHLPQDARACPQCGTITPAYYATPGEGQAQTAISSGHAQGQSTSAPYDTPYDTPYTDAPPAPHTGYGTNPYGQTSNPYGGATTTPPPPPEKKPRIILIGAGLLVLVVLIVGTVILLPRLGHSNPDDSSSKVIGTQTATVPQTETNPTPLTADQAQDLYNETVARPPTLNDTLAGPDNYGWDNKTLDYTSCAFKDGTYHSKAVPEYFSPCYAGATNFSNFLFQAEMTVIDGHSGGLVFRADKTNDKSYLFRISTDGAYILKKYSLDSDNQLKEDILTSGQSTEVKTGASQANTLAVIVRGNDIYVFINAKYVATAHDGLYRSGGIGVYSDSDAGDVEVSFRNAQVWTLD